MAIVDNTFGVGLDAAQKATYGMSKAAASQLSNSVDNMFAKMHESHGDVTRDNPYRSEDYYRMAFQTKEQASQFVNDMQAKGVDVVVSQVKINGRYMAEMHNQFSASNFMGENNQEQQQQVQMYAEDVVRWYERENMTDIEDVNKGQWQYSTGTDANNPVETEMNAFEHFVASNFDLMGKAFIEGDRMVNSLMAYSDSVVNSNAFTSGFDKMERAKTGDYGEFIHERDKNGNLKYDDYNHSILEKDPNGRLFAQSAGKLRLDDRKNTHLNTAKVIDGKYVIVNGKRVDENSKEYKAVMKAFRQRESAAKGFADANTDRSAFVNRVLRSKKSQELREKRQESARRMLDDMYSGDDGKFNTDSLYGQQEFVAMNTINYSLRKGGYLDQIKNQINEQKTIEKLQVENAMALELQNEAFNSELTQAIERDFNINLSNGIERQTFLDMQNKLIDRSAKAGLQLVDKHGNFNVDGFRKLSDKELKALGISKKSQEVIIGLNEKGAWGALDMSGFGAAFGKGLGYVNRAVGDKDMSDMINVGTKTVRYTKKGINVGTNFASAVKQKAADYRLKHPGKERNKKQATEKTKVKKPKDDKLKEVNKKANEKFKKKQAKKLKKLERSEKSLIAKYNRAKTTLMKRLANSHIGRLATAIKQKAMLFVSNVVMPFVGAFLGILGFVSVLIGVLVAIGSFFDSEDEDAWKKTAAYKLNEELQTQENRWLVDLQDGEDLFETKKDMTFGEENEEYETYIDGFDNLVADDDKLYINPFWQVEGLVTADNDNKDLMTEVKKEFNGATNYYISANVNKYGEKDISGEESTEEGEPVPAADSEETEDAEEGEDHSHNDPFVSTESGHTSNIKDILAMLDVMYQFDLTASGDGELTSVLGMTPAQINWTYFKQNVLGRIKYVGKVIATWFKRLFGSDEPYPEWKIGSVSYNTLRNYVETLFSSSHQEMVQLTVNYYPIGSLECKVGGEDAELGTECGLTEQDACKLGICIDPHKQKFEIDFNADNKIVPIIEAEDGTVYDLTVEDQFDIVITIEDNYKGDMNKLCLWDTMASDEATYNRILSLTTDPGCWKLSNKDERDAVLRGESSAITTKTCSVSIWENYCTSLNNMLKTSGYTVGYGTATPTVYHMYELSEDKDTFTYSYFTLVGTEGSMAIVGLVQDIYKRDCQGHEFTYCGGHVGADVQGIVYSMQNEQMSIIGCYNEDYEFPYVKDLDLETIGWGDIEGKHLPEKADYTTPATAAFTGGCQTPEYSVQGSFSGHRGINFAVEGSATSDDGSDVAPSYEDLDESGNPTGESSYVEVGDTNAKWLKGIVVRDGFRDNLLLLRDIFDIDCMLDKGCNMFPFNKKEFEQYEGWSEDNITLALMKTTDNWYEVYEFDIPMELGEIELDSEDIDAIIKQLKADGQLGEDEEREDFLRMVLCWVGRAHYSDYHTDHNLLSELCKASTSVTLSTEPDAGGAAGAGALPAEGGEEGETGTGSVCYDANCTAGNSESFVNFIYNYNERTIGSWNTYTGVDNLSPGDVILHEGNDSFDDLNLTEDDASDLDINVLVDYTKDVYSIYIGEIKEDIECKDGITVIEKGYLTVDLNTNGVVGTVRFRTKKSECWSDPYKNVPKDGDGFVTDPKRNEKNDNAEDGMDYSRYNYYWITTPDSHTKYAKYS